jgi:antitoxin component YwqK of YwqJK toxin-antitoxin module
MFGFTLGFIREPTREKKVLVTLYIPTDAITNENRKEVVNIKTALHKTSKAMPVMIQDINLNMYESCLYAYKSDIIFNLNHMFVMSECFMSKPTKRNVSEEAVTRLLENSLYYYKSVEPFHFMSETEVRNCTLKKWFSNGQIENEITIVNGKRHGTQIIYNKDGTVKSTLEYENDMLNGYTRTYHQTGYRHLDIHFLNNKKQGLCRKWKADGCLEKSYIFDEDTLIEEIPNNSYFDSY